MKVMVVVGARPNFMKAAPIISALRELGSSLASADGPGNDRPKEGICHLLVHTGQHYDTAMSGSFFSDLDLPAPDIDLGVGSGSHAVQTAEIMKKFEAVLLRERPGVVVVVGDVNSTLACALTAAKVSFGPEGHRPLIAHIEAGLRSGDRSMPEEINRVLTDHLSDLLFVTEESGLRNLAAEGIASEKVHFVGNTMIDSLLSSRQRADASTVLDTLGLRTGAHGNGSAVSQYALLTLHRPANVDRDTAFSSILEGLRELGAERPIIFPAHPRTRRRIREFGLERYFQWQPAGNGRIEAAAQGERGIRVIDPLGYLDFLCLMKNATLVVTDSGGIQEETTCLGIPCVTVRQNTERPVTVESGTNVIAGTGDEGIAAAIRAQLKNTGFRKAPEKWDGQAAGRIVSILSAANPHSAQEGVRCAGTPQPQ
ncbi:MAG: non-hydrolyzing UDP-N-acetylglucosamine 2-epimerase [Terriglobia bacterium]